MGIEMGAVKLATRRHERLRPGSEVIVHIVQRRSQRFVVEVINASKCLHWVFEKKMMSSLALVGDRGVGPVLGHYVLATRTCS